MRNSHSRFASHNWMIWCGDLPEGHRPQTVLGVESKMPARIHNDARAILSNVRPTSPDHRCRRMSGTVGIFHGRARGLRNLKGRDLCLTGCGRCAYVTGGRARFRPVS